MNTNINESKNKPTDKFKSLLRNVNIIFFTLCLGIFILGGYHLYRIFFDENSNIEINMTQDYNILNVDVKADRDIKTIVALIDSDVYETFIDTDKFKIVLPQETKKHTVSIYASDSDGCSTNTKDYYMYTYTVYVLNSKDKSDLSDEFAELGIKNVYLAGIPEPTQRDMYVTVRNLLAKYPEATGLVDTLWVDDLDKLDHQEGTHVAATYASLYTPNGLRGTITINSKLLSDQYTFLETGEIILDFVHEYGHALNAALGDKKLNIEPGEKDYNKFLAAVDEFKNVGDQIYNVVDEKEDLTKEKVTRKVTEYANASSNEFFAECFARKECYGQSNEVIDTALEEYSAELKEAEFKNNK